jgi:hypothetical protein
METDMSAITDASRDVLLVCANGHVLTDRLRAQPDQQRGHCDRCGAPTLSRCRTCGAELPGAPAVLGLEPVGRGSPPRYCSACGAAFPWTKTARPVPPGTTLAALEHLLRRLPRTIRELRLQAKIRPPFRLDDERDLEYLLRALLPLCCDDVRLHGRTPRYALFARTDFVLMPAQIALTVKLVTGRGGEQRLHEQVTEDADYYSRQANCRVLIVLVYDAPALLPCPEDFERQLSASGDGVEVRCVVAR